MNIEDVSFRTYKKGQIENEEKECSVIETVFILIFAIIYCIIFFIPLLFYHRTLLLALYHMLKKGYGFYESLKRAVHSEFRYYNALYQLNGNILRGSK